MAAAVLLAWVSGLTYAQAQEIPWVALDKSASSGTQVQQHVFLDETQALGLQAARAGEFKPFKSLQRLQMEGKTTWLRLSISRAEVLTTRQSGGIGSSAEKPRPKNATCLERG